MNNDSLFTFMICPIWCVNVNAIIGTFFSRPFNAVVDVAVKEENCNGNHTVKCRSLSNANCILISSPSSGITIVKEEGFSTLNATILFFPKLGQCFSKTSTHCVRCLVDLKCIRALVGTISPRCKSPLTK